MHQPMVEPVFRRGSFAMESSLRTAAPSSDAAQSFQQMLNHSERPVPSRRSSLRAVPSAYDPPPPPPPPASVMESMRMQSHSSMRSPSPTPSPIVDMSPGRQVHHSPVRGPPSLSSVPRRNSSQAEHFVRSSLSPPPSANNRSYSFAREQARIPTVAGGPLNHPARTNSCPPDADMMFQTRGGRSNSQSDGYNSASTFMTECSVSPTSSDSSQPSDVEESGGGHHHHAHIKTKAPENDFTALEMESRRRELVWQETEKQWRDKHGSALPRSQDMAFRRKIEGGVGIKDDSPIDKEWRDMWKNTNDSWVESEARWRKEDAHRRTASRNEDSSHFHTAHSDSRNAAPVADDDKVMNAIFSHFEKEMEKRRLRAEKKRLEEVEQCERIRREQESDIWRATLESDSRRSSGQGLAREYSPEHNWLPDRLLRPDMSRTRSSSVIVEPRPAFQRSRSGSVATIVDPIAAEVPPPPPLPTTIPVTLGAAVESNRIKRSRSSRESRESFDLPIQEDDSVRPPVTPAEKQRTDEVRKGYLNTARQHHYTPASEAPRQHPQPDRAQHVRDSSDDTERDTPRPRGHQRIPSTPGAEAHSPRPSLSPSVSSRDVPQVVQQDNSFSIVDEVLKLEREQAAIARRIQALRAVAGGNPEGPKYSPPSGSAPILAPVEQERERGREKMKEVKVKESDKPRAKSQVTRKHSHEGAVFKAMQEQSRKSEQAGTQIRKPEPTINPDFRPATAAPTVGEPSGRGVHFKSDKASAEDLPSPTPPRVRTPGPSKIQTPARVRTPSPRSNSPVHTTTNVTREAPIMREAVPPVHEAVAPSSPPRLYTMDSQPTLRPSAPVQQQTLRPSGKSRDAGLNAERPKSGTMPTLSVPHVNTSNSPIDGAHDQGVSPMGAKTPRATSFDHDRTPRVQTGPVPVPAPESADKPGSPPMPRVYINPNQARARAEAAAVPVEPPVRMEESNRRRMDAAVGANVAAAAAETFDRARGKKQTKEAEHRAQEERRVAEEQLAQERRRAEEERRLREEQRAEDIRRREAAERRDREARYEQQKRERERESEDRKRRWAYDPATERATRAQQQQYPTREPSALDAWNSYELRWSALSVASSPNQPIGFRDIPWPLLRVPTGPESFTPQAVGAFILSPLHSQDKTRKERIRNAMLRWHSDKFEGRWMSRIEEAERPRVQEAVGAVARCLTELMTKPDLYTF